jgi:hypothetical protein
VEFKAKIFKLGNSRAIYIPKCIYNNLTVPENVYTFDIKLEDVYTKTEPKIIREATPLEEKIMGVGIKVESKKKDTSIWCSKHKGSRKWTCGCK